ncbi:MAG: tetratricopeptide repeat protein [Betaproteobacteria bacterium]|nr:tetratricopeptide repeat protein [Betaproteobacteria bacterium]
MSKFRSSAFLLSIALASATGPVLAQSNEGEFRALLKEQKVAEAESLARERIAKNPKDDVALWFLVRTMAGDEKKREVVIPLAEQCIAALPQSARCHHALGTLFGAAAQSGGFSAALKYGSRIKEEFVKAAELDPKFFEARRDLGQFYLQAPGIAGGSVRKAIENADEFARIDANRGALMRADVHVYEKEFDQAEKVLSRVQAGSDTQLAEALTQSWAGVGFSLINEKEPAKAQKLFERLVAADMSSAFAHFGLGRAQLENKLVDAAIASFERALQLNDKLRAHYRLGIAYQTKGDKPKALAAFQQFISYQANGSAADDARSRIEVLKRG